jgi:hypothetical protein
MRELRASDVRTAARKLGNLYPAYLGLLQQGLATGLDDFSNPESIFLLYTRSPRDIFGYQKGVELDEEEISRIGQPLTYLTERGARHRGRFVRSNGVITVADSITTKYVGLRKLHACDFRHVFLLKPQGVKSIDADRIVDCSKCTAMPEALDTVITHEYYLQRLRSQRIVTS